MNSSHELFKPTYFSRSQTMYLVQYLFSHYWLDEFCMYNCGKSPQAEALLITLVLNFWVATLLVCKKKKKKM